MSNIYIHSTIANGNFEIPIFIVSLQIDTYRRSLLREFLPEKIINNYFPASDFRNISDSELDKLMDIEKLFNNKNYNRKLTGGEIGCADSHREIYKYMEGNNIPFALILEDDVLPQKKWEHKLEKIIADLKSIDNDVSFVCNIGIDYYRSVPQKIIFRKLFPLRVFRTIRLVDFTKTNLWLTHSYFINLAGAKNLLNNYNRHQTTCDDWKFFCLDKSLDYVFISECIFTQNQTLESNITGRQVINTKFINRSKIYLLFIPIIVSVKMIVFKINPQNWMLINI